jgi:ATP-binding cassette, subfamily B, bacterial MsbA
VVTNDVAVVRSAFTDDGRGDPAQGRGVAGRGDRRRVLQDWFLALIAFVVFPASVLPSQAVAAAAPFRTGGQVSMGNLTALLQETDPGQPRRQGLRHGGYERRRFDEENERLFALSCGSRKIRAFTSPMMEVLAAFGIAGVVLYGGYERHRRRPHAGRVSRLPHGVVPALRPVQEALAKRQYRDAAGTGRGRSGLRDARHRARRARPPGRGGARADEDGHRFEHVGFRYDSRPVLRDVTSHPRGEVVALVGPSGGGKSTLADLIPRFYDVTERPHPIDGVDIRDVTLASLRSQIALVTQHTFLFNDTVRNNIAYGLAGPLDEAIEAAGAPPTRTTRSFASCRRATTPRSASSGCALSGAATAPRHRPRPAQGRADPGPRRGDVGARQRVRTLVQARSRC